MKPLTQKDLEPHLHQWVEKGLLRPEQSGPILELYPKSKKNRFLEAMALLGCFFGVLGISLIVASNWQQIPNLIKLGGLLFLLIAAMLGGIEFSRPDIPMWQREGCFLLAAVMPLLGLCLLSQMFHVEGRLTGLFASWLGMIVLLPLLSRSLSAWAVVLVAMESLLLSWLIDYGIPWEKDPNSFFAWCVLYGLGIIACSQGWRIVQLPDFQALGEYWGWFHAAMFGYCWGFVGDTHRWILIWVAILFASIGLIYLGLRRHRPNQVNLGFIMIGLISMSFYIRLINTMLNTGLLFLTSGCVLVGVVYVLQWQRKKILRK